MKVPVPPAPVMTATPGNFLRIDAMTAESIQYQRYFRRIVMLLPGDSTPNLTIMTFYRLRDLHLSNDPCCWRGAVILVQNWSQADMNSRGCRTPLQLQSSPQASTPLRQQHAPTPACLQPLFSGFQAYRTSDTPPTHTYVAQEFHPHFCLEHHLDCGLAGLLCPCVTPD